jgi:uncharacterized protein YecT (DUF1311 family)/sugar lactone lactonase YvrE
MKRLNRLFIAVTLAGLATALACVNARAAGNLAIDGTGNLFAASSSSHSIFKFTPDGTKSTFATRVSPDKMVLDGAGNLFVTEEHFQEDRHADLIFKFTPDGKKSTFASGLEDLSSMVLDGAGNLFVRERHFEKDHDVEVIFKFTPDGKKSTFASGSDYGDMAFDGAGNLFVVDSVRNAGSSILKFTPDGKQSTFASGVSTLDYGVHNLAFDDNGNLFVSVYGYAGDTGSTILKFTPDGNKSAIASGLAPEGLAFDRSGNLFVTQDISPSILKFTPDGKKSTFATGIKPYGMALDAAGTLFVLEYGSDLIFKFTPDGTRSTFVSDRVSPDKQWEYQCSADRENPRIVKAGTSQTVLDLSEQVSDSGNEARIVWAPDSKRFALNYTDPQPRARADTTALYQLRGGKWVKLRSPVTDETTKPVERAHDAQLRKMHLYPGHIWHSEQVRKWTDGSTALLYSELSVMGEEDPRWVTTFLFTLKFDAQGNWKIVKSHQMSDKEVEKEDAGEDVSGPVQTTVQEGPSADASFRDADRHLNEVYNALRARLSPSERTGLKKEQLAWLNERNAAVQDAKKNAQENPTDVADREVTTMTLARVAELEKRLKKAK